MSDNELAAAAGSLTRAAATAPPLLESSTGTPAGGGGLLAMIERLATSPNINIDVFERLLAARRQEEDRVAERAFNAAMSLAKGELEPVIKTNQVDFTGKSGTRTRYKYEAFADVARVVDPVFARHGLAYRFSNAQTGDMLTVTCIVSHADGFSERTKLESKIDPGVTGMSNVQALGSALTYLQRYSLRAAIGLAAGVDDDGRAAGGPSPRISQEQSAELARLIEETGRSETTLLRLVGVESIEDMTVNQWTRAKEVLDLAKAQRRQPGNDNAP